MALLKTRSGCGASRVARLRLGQLNIPLVMAIMCSKVLLILFDIALAFLVTRRTDGTGFMFTLGGITSLLTTMSDDMGVGLPLFVARGPRSCLTRACCCGVGCR